MLARRRQRLSHAFERIAETLDPLVVVQRNFTDEDNPKQIASRIRATIPKRAALILAVPNSPEVNLAVEAVLAQGIPVVHVVTRATVTAGAFVGIDNYAAGRSAALFLSRMSGKSGPVIAFCHPIYQVHRDRIRGFSDYLSDHASDLEFGQVLFSHDDENVTADLLLETLKACPDLAGIYNVGGANSALIKVLRRHPRAKDIFFIGHELTDYTASALRDGTMDVVIDQAPESQAERALDLVLHRIGVTKIASDQSPIRFITITAESI